jgi:hypothetical protein
VYYTLTPPHKSVPAPLEAVVRSKEFDSAGHLLRGQQVVHQNETPEDVTRRSGTLWSVGNARVNRSFCMKSKKVAVMSHQYPSGVSGKRELLLIRGAKQIGFGRGCHVDVPPSQTRRCLAGHLLAKMKPNRQRS